MDEPPKFPDQEFFDLMRVRDFKAAVHFATERLRESLRSGDKNSTIDASHLLIASLVAAGPDQEALALLWQVVNSFPEEPYLRSIFADFLLFTMKQPLQALEIITPVLGELLAEEGSRHATLGLQGAILSALGRHSGAEECLREMLQPSLWRMMPSGFDFRLVESLIPKGLARSQCAQYLEIAYRRAQESNDREVMARAESLLRALR